MALSLSALVTVGEARTYLQAEPTDDPKDDLLELLIEGLGARIAQKTGDMYVNPAATEDEADPLSQRVYGFDPSEGYVAVDYCREVAAVAATASPGDTDSWRALEASTYYLEPVGQPVTDKITFLANAVDLPAQAAGWDGLALHARSPYSADTMWTPWPRADAAEVNVRAFARVEAKFGFGAGAEAVPMNVKLALLMWLENIHHRDIAFTSETIGVATATMRMPADVEELLEGETDAQSSVVAI